ncbi:DUF882 domain-containing protein [Rhizobium sp. BK399]|uniref:DUF882 domain-containing protein n=1 Tax=Rhizobium sp. BK399 TaxID=2587063 RepID=UPI0017F048FC|nr:DUF882 domain-containing protein [Rhizobium sp. BK399]MBB3544494.1 uncharacterized protein YcbK (DUF882 family) [Rhizobium sp. BK399]
MTRIAMSGYASNSQAIGRTSFNAVGVLCYVVRRVRQVAIALLAVLGFAVDAAAEDRALKLFFTHTGERATIIFKRDGKFDPRGLAQVNRFLRDWRRNEPARMDPRLLDLVWEVYGKSGARDYIHVVSAYRSPTTNNMLRSRSRSSGVAKSSQHMLGKAMDFYIPGVKLATLRALAMQKQEGGVGYYPRSGSPFVHLDVGRVRAWPRMSRQELASIFPSGRTMHVPADGRPLPNYNQAIADSKKRAGLRTIDIAATLDEDDTEETGTTRASGANLKTALLAVSSSLAEAALARQIAQGGSDRKETEKSFADLSAMAVPVPTLRTLPIRNGHETDPIQTASIGETSPIGVAEAPRVFGGPKPATMTLSKGDVAELPLSASRELQAGIGRISARRLMTWALHGPGQMQDLSSPRIARRTILQYGEL